MATVKDLAAYVCDKLAGKVLIHRYDAYSTNSVYLKFDYGLGNSLRLSDHTGKAGLNYRFNIITTMKSLGIDTSGEYPRFYYPPDMVDQAIADIVKGVTEKRGRYDQVIYIGTRKHTITHAELWWTGGVKYFKTDAFAGTIAGDFIVDTEHGDETNDYTEPHFTVGNKAYNWDTVPIVWLKYNEEELPLCYFIKDLIDDINWQTSVTADVLRDVAKFIYILKNYGGQDLGEFIKDLKEHMAIKVTTDGGVDKLQADLNIDAVMAFLDKQRRDVYDFAAAVDTKDPDLGNASGTAINFRYMDLSSDCDSLATELKDTFQRLKLFIDVYLQIAGKGDFSKETFDIVFNMDLPVNETDVIQNAVASESLLSKRTILQNHPWVTDADEEMERIDAEKKAAMEEYGEGLFGDALGAGKGQNGQGDPVNGGGADGNE